jgi:hypothetical protein
MNIGRSKDDPLSKDRELTDFCNQWLDDQAAWLDDCMKKLLPEPLYRAAHRGEKLGEIARWLDRNDFQVTHVVHEGRPCGMRLMQREKVVAELRQRVTVDDEIQHPYTDIP